MNSYRSCRVADRATHRSRSAGEQVIGSFAPYAGTSPTIITVPGLGNSGPTHWQTLWERDRPNVYRAELGLWDRPHRNSWVTRLDEAIRRAQAPVVLVAHSLGCLTVAWWASLSPQPYGWPVAGALLVAPADVDRDDAPAELRGFAPSPAAPLPFASIVVASQDDPWISLTRAHSLAAAWGSHFVDIGALGHVNAASGLGVWPDGAELLDRLIAATADPRPATEMRRALQAPSRGGVVTPGGAEHHGWSPRASSRAG